MNKRNSFSPEVRERAVRMVLEHQDDHRSQWGAIRSIAEKFGCAPETLRAWVRKAERDEGLAPRPDDPGDVPSQGAGAGEPGATAGQ